jgi:hypothetical protein
VGEVGSGALLAVHGEGVSVVQVARVQRVSSQDHATPIVGGHGECSGSPVDGDDPAALAGDQLALVVGSERDDEVADGEAAAIGGFEVGPTSQPSCSARTRASRLRSATLLRRHASIKVSWRAAVSAAQASTIAARVSLRVGGDADPLVGGVEAGGGYDAAAANGGERCARQGRVGAGSG